MKSAQDRPRGELAEPLDRPMGRRILAQGQMCAELVSTHLSLEKDAPLGRPVQAIGSLAAVPLLGGLHHEYVRMA
jgi:hypothetical protein